MGETLSDIIKHSVQDDDRNPRMGAFQGQLMHVKILGAIGAISLVAALGIWVGEFLRVSGR